MFVLRKRLGECGLSSAGLFFKRGDQVSVDHALGLCGCSCSLQFFFFSLGRSELAVCGFVNKFFQNYISHATDLNLSQLSVEFFLLSYLL